MIDSDYFLSYREFALWVTVTIGLVWSASLLAAIPQISTSDTHTSVIAADGSLWAWGAGYAGALGDGATENRLSPVKIGSGYRQVYAGYGFTLAVKADGTLWAWGSNISGQLGDGTTTNRLQPVQIGAGFAAVSGTWLSGIGLKQDGSLWTWGAKSISGVLGNGTASPTTVPLTPKQIDTGYIAIAGGQANGLALKADGSLWGWGLNAPVDGSILVPTKIGDGYVAMTGGEGFSFGLKADGTLWGWGDNSWGQLGIGSTISMYTPVRVLGNGYVAVTTGSFHTTALKADGSLWSWGLGIYGARGDGTESVTVTTPIKISDGYWKTTTNGGNNNGFAIKPDGSVWAWGVNVNGYLGDGTSIHRLVPTPNGFNVYVSSGLTAQVNAQGPLTRQTLQATIAPNSGDAGKQGCAFVAAVPPDRTTLLVFTPRGWGYYDAANPLAYFCGTMEALDFSLIDNADLSGIVGAEVYLGYGLGGTVQQSLADMLERGLLSRAYTVQ